MNKQAADDFDSITQYYLAFQRFRAGVLKPKPEMLLLKEGCIQLVKLNTLYLKLNPKTKPACHDCRECSYQSCPHTLSTTLFQPLLVEKWEEPYPAHLKSLEDAFAAHLLTLEISLLAGWIGDVKFRGKFKAQANGIAKSVTKFKDETRREFIRILDKTTKGLPIYSELMAL